jgi:AcrR family transcriptional regulator
MPASETARGAERTTRNRILEEAAGLFRREGFNGASMQDLAAVVGITKSTLYHHFPSKQALLSEILELTVDRVTPVLEAIAEADLPAATRLRQAVTRHIVELIHDQDNVACFIEEGRFLAPEFRQSHIAKRDGYEQHFRRIVADGVRTGEFRQVHVRLASMAVLGMCNSVSTWYRPDGDFRPDEIAGQFGELAVRALSSPDRAKGEIASIGVVEA